MRVLSKSLWGRAWKSLPSGGCVAVTKKAATSSPARKTEVDWPYVGPEAGPSPSAYSYES